MPRIDKFPAGLEFALLAVANLVLFDLEAVAATTFPGR